MNTPTPLFHDTFAQAPLVAILRGICSDEVESIALALYEEGFRFIEIPMNSPQALATIARLVRCLPNDAQCGAGTVLHIDTVHQLRDVGARLVVMPHTDVEVIQSAKQAGLICIPGATTVSEIFAGMHAGADAVKLFPAELVSPAGIRAMRAVLPPGQKLLPVGGITPNNMAAYFQAGVDGFGLGSALYKPGMTAGEVKRNARSFIAAWQSLYGSCE